MSGRNIRGLLFTVQKALPLMPPGSSIILNASTTSIKGTPASISKPNATCSSQQASYLMS